MKVSVSTPVAFSAHAIQRYGERIGTAQTTDAVPSHLANLAGASTITPTPPRWLTQTAKEHSPLYLTLGSDIVFPLVYDEARGALVAKTCLAKGGLSSASRERRSHTKAQRRAQRRRSS